MPSTFSVRGWTINNCNAADWRYFHLDKAKIQYAIQRSFHMGHKRYITWVIIDTGDWKESILRTNLLAIVWKGWTLYGLNGNTHPSVEHWKVITVPAMMHLLLHSFHRSYSSCIGYVISRCNCPVHSLINLSHIIGPFCCSTCFLIEIRKSNQWLDKLNLHFSLIKLTRISSFITNYLPLRSLYSAGKNFRD